MAGILVYPPTPPEIFGSFPLKYVQVGVAGVLQHEDHEIRQWCMEGRALVLNRANYFNYLWSGIQRRIRTPLWVGIGFWLLVT
mgnify:CR=1 FL=1